MGAKLQLGARAGARFAISPEGMTHGRRRLSASSRSAVPRPLQARLGSFDVDAVTSFSGPAVACLGQARVGRVCERSVEFLSPEKEKPWCALDVSIARLNSKGHRARQRPAKHVVG